MSPFNFNNIINWNSINTILHKIIKEFKIKCGTTKRIMKPRLKELNKFHRDNNITEFNNTKIFKKQKKSIH